jgi:hypothetical protein
MLRGVLVITAMVMALLVAAALGADRGPPKPQPPDLSALLKRLDALEARPNDACVMLRAPALNVAVYETPNLGVKVPPPPKEKTK